MDDYLPAYVDIKFTSLMQQLLPSSPTSELLVYCCCFFVQVSMTVSTSLQRAQIVIPAQGMIEIRDTLTELLKDFGTDDRG